MPRSLSVSSAMAAAALAALVTSTDARAQDLQPPPPMDPNAPGGAPSPGSPGSPSPGSPGSPSPGPVDPNNPNAPPGSGDATQKKLDEAEREDSGRNFEIFYLDTSLGGSYINMKAFDSTNLGIKEDSSAGPMFSLGAGFRLVVLTIGARMKYNALSAFNMWQLNLEVGFKIPISQVDILIGPHGGYSFVGSLGDANQVGNTNTPSVKDAVSIRGFNVGLDLAVDYYINPYFSVGGGFFTDFLYLNRPPVELPADTPADVAAQIQADPQYQQSGTSAGFQLGGGLRLGLHLGI